MVRLEQVVMWLFIILAAVGLGGGFYELRVVLPLWTHAPPESVWHFNELRTTEAAFLPNSGTQFWIYVTPFHLLVSLVMFVLGWFTRGRHRFFILISSATFVLLHLAAVVYFVPLLNQLMDSRQLGLDPEYVASNATLWKNLTWGRGFIGLFGFVMGLIAVRTPPLIDERPA